MNTIDNDDLRRQAKELAARFLDNLGYELIARDWKWRGGQVDIIARDADSLVFVEVGASQTAPVPEPADHRAQREGFERAAFEFIGRHDVSGVCARLDEVHLLMDLDAGRAIIRHHLDVFAHPEA